MLVRAALVPGTVLLVPGASGSADPLREARTAAQDAVRWLLDPAPDRCVVLACSPRRSTDRRDDGAPAPTLGAAGVPTPGSRADLTATAHPDAVTSAGLLLLADAGWSGPVTAVALAPPPRDAAALRLLGADLVGDGRVAVLALGSLSARRGPDAPLPEHPDAAAVDEALLTDLVDLADAGSRERLATFDGGTARDLAISAWGPWQVLLGAVADSRAASRLLHAEPAHGVLGPVVTWDAT